MNSVYGMRPINKTAGLVTGQNGCGDGRLTDEQHRDVLVSRYQYITGQFEKYPKKCRERTALVEEQHELQKQISEINKRLKRKGALPDLAEDIILLIKNRMTKPEYNRLIDEAKERYNARLAEYNKQSGNNSFNE